MVRQYAFHLEKLLAEQGVHDPVIRARTMVGYNYRTPQTMIDVVGGVEHGQGAGIGLSFCRMVMESIGGSIDCESLEGEHTTFTLTFPAAN